MRHAVAVCCVAASLVLVTACGSEPTVTTRSVPGGTYKGTITDVTLAERTLTVALPEGDTLRAFFADSARVMNDSLEVGFGSLVEGERVRLAVQRGPERLNARRIEVVQPANPTLAP